MSLSQSIDETAIRKSTFIERFLCVWKNNVVFVQCNPVNKVLRRRHVTLTVVIALHLYS